MGRFLSSSDLAGFILGGSKNVVERARDLIAKVSVIEDLSKELTSIDHMISEYLGRVGRDAS
jgi:hypothetical protein